VKQINDDAEPNGCNTAGEFVYFAILLYSRVGLSRIQVFFWSLMRQKKYTQNLSLACL
jgi:hypothetical protein